jgi:hypothetical protein
VKKIRTRITYANVMSSLAVFLVLGGATAFAASGLGRNSVGSKQLKRNAVTGVKIKKGAVTGAKIKSGSITGTQIKSGSLDGSKINVGSLGTVPSAASAASAASAGSVSGFGHKGVVGLSATIGATEESAREAAPATTLFTAGPLTIYAKCYSFGTTVKGAVYLSTSTNGVILSSEQENYDGTPDFLNAGTPEPKRIMEYESIGPASAKLLEYSDTGFYAMAPGGAAITGLIPLAIRNGALTEGDGAYGGNSCVFSGFGISG